MHKATVAERILSLAVSPDQAAAMTGDFLEQEDRRPAGWFWYSVIRTLCALSARSLATQPKTLAFLALRGFLFLFLWQLPVLVCTVMLNINLRPQARDAVFPWLVVISLVMSQFMVGRGVARRSPGRELPAWLALAILETAVNTAIILCTGSGWRTIPLSLACFLLYQIPAFTGATLVRPNSVRHARH
jgi:hypothetical protein